MFHCPSLSAVINILSELVQSGPIKVRAFLLYLTFTLLEPSVLPSYKNLPMSELFFWCVFFFWFFFSLEHRASNLWHCLVCKLSSKTHGHFLTFESTIVLKLEFICIPKNIRATYRLEISEIKKSFAEGCPSKSKFWLWSKRNFEDSKKA